VGITFRMAWRNLWRHGRRTWLTISAIAFASLLLVFMISLQLGAYDMMIDTSVRVYTGQLQVQREGYLDKPRMRTSISEATSLAGRLRVARPDVVFAVRAQGFALASSGTRTYGVPVVGVEPGYETKVSTIPRRITTGRNLSAADAPEVVIGAVLARNLRITVGQELTLLGSGRDGSIAAAVLPVVGIFESGNPELDRHIVQMGLSEFQDVFSMGDHAHAIVVSGLPMSALQEQATQIRALLPAEANLVVLDWDRLLPGIREAIQADMVQNWFTYIILIAVVTFSILNTFLMAVLERTREFGIMLALGATPFRIGALVLLESAMLTMIGLIIGIAAGGGVAFYFYLEGFTLPGMKELYGQFGLPGVITPKLSLTTLTLGPAVIFCFTLAAALYPALRVRRLQPVEAMHAV